ncbi:MAG TPA: hypothetical protein RMH99_11440 [Sandaracinaceae bacterium LLY-WYZ-13_1]|nr:hypothetical protein [Sandaracinaceae bacterium LLY-WYZ-13_1]
MRVSVAWVGLGAALAGCALVNDPGAHQDPVELDEICGALAELQCESYERCCPALDGPLTEDERDACELSARASCRDDPLQGALYEDPRAGYDALTAAQTIAEGYGFLDDACDTGIADWYRRRDGLFRFLTGTVAGGGECTPRSDPGNPGSDPDVAALFSCADFDQSCAPDRTGTQWSCVARGGEDDPCLLFLDCVDGLFCDRSSQTCQPRLGLDYSCSSDEQCESLSCAAGRCVPRTARSVFCGSG